MEHIDHISNQFSMRQFRGHHSVRETELKWLTELDLASLQEIITHFYLRSFSYVSMSTFIAESLMKLDIIFNL